MADLRDRAEAEAIHEECKPKSALVEAASAERSLYTARVDRAKIVVQPFHL